MFNNPKRRTKKLQIKESKRELREFDRKVKHRRTFARDQKRDPKEKNLFLDNPPSIPGMKRQENQQYWLAIQLLFFLIVFVVCAIWLGKTLASH